jgi:hypothetical protein
MAPIITINPNLRRPDPGSITSSASVECFHFLILFLRSVGPMCGNYPLLDMPIERALNYAHSVPGVV